MSAPAPRPATAVETFAFPLGAFPTVRAALWVNFLRSLAPSLVAWSALASVARWNADFVSLAIGAAVSGGLHYIGHRFAGLIIVPGQAKATAGLLSWLSGQSLLDRFSPGLRAGLANAGRRLEQEEQFRPANGQRLLASAGGVRVRLRIAMAFSGGDIDAAVMGGATAPVPSGPFLKCLAASGLGPWAGSGELTSSGSARGGALGSANGGSLTGTGRSHGESFSRGGSGTGSGGSRSVASARFDDDIGRDVGGESLSGGRTAAAAAAADVDVDGDVDLQVDGSDDDDDDNDSGDASASLLRRGAAAAAAAAGSGSGVTSRGRGSGPAGAGATTTSSSSSAAAAAAAAASGGPKAHLCVVYFGGNAELWERLREVERLLGRGCVIVAPNYPGVGDSSGHSTASGMLLAGAAALEFAQIHLGFERRRIVLFGHSIGGAVACELARHYPDCHLIADRTFGRLADVAATVVTRMIAPAAALRTARADAEATAALTSSSSGRFELGGPGGGGRLSSSSSPALAAAAVGRRVGPPPPASMVTWGEAAVSVESWARLLLLVGVGWELDGASAYRALLLREKAARSRLMMPDDAPARSTSGGAGSVSGGSGIGSGSGSDAIARALIAARDIPGLGNRLMLFSPADRVIPVRVSLPFTLGCYAADLIPPSEGVGMVPTGGDEHNRDFTPPEWARVAAFLDRCARHV